MPKVRSCHTLLVCQAAQCRPATRSYSIPGNIRTNAPNPFKAGCDARTLTLDQDDKSNAKSPGGRLMGIRSRGLGEKICARQTCRYEGQTAAHFQITERNTSL